MKKMKFFATAATFVVVATAGYFGYTAYRISAMTDAERMIEANFEALTQDESGITDNCEFGGAGCELYLNKVLVFSSEIHYNV
ncbi:MAG: hypothetical protein R3Y26_01395 [Rikenellaceae bacterium]